MAETATSRIVANRKWKMPTSHTNSIERTQESAASVLPTLGEKAAYLENIVTSKFQRELHDTLTELLRDPLHPESTGNSSIQERTDVLNVRKNEEGQLKLSRMPHKKVFHLRSSLLTSTSWVNHCWSVRIALFFPAAVTLWKCRTFEPFELFLWLFVCSPFSHRFYLNLPCVRVVFDCLRSVILDLKLILWSFGKFPLAVLAWVAVQLSLVFLLFLPFFIWTTRRTGGRLRANLFDYFMLTYCIGYAVALGYFPAHFIVQNALSPASTLFLACEQIRMLMKIYSFIREKAVDAFMSETGNATPQLSNFLYFLFAPTLLYRDTYPRIPGPVRWLQVAYHFAGFLLAVMCGAHILQHFFAPTFASIDYARGLTRSELIQLIFRCSIPAITIKFIVFYGILHSWLNLFAEMLQFGDREFYRDWWNSTNYSYYFRTWNIVVHEWLHQYCYRDLSLLFARRNLQPVWQMTTVLLSAVMHEYFVTLTLNCFFPIMFVLFAGSAIVRIFLYSGRGSQYLASITIWWLSLFLAYGLQMTFYVQEWYARQKCPSIFLGENEKWKDFFVPRLLTCGWSAANSSSNVMLNKDTVAVIHHATTSDL